MVDMNRKQYADTVRIRPETEDPISVEDQLLAIIAKIARLTSDHPAGTCQNINRLCNKTLDKYGLTNEHDD